MSYCGVRFGRDVHIGWDCIVMDTDFHKMVFCTVAGSSLLNSSYLELPSHSVIGQVRSVVLKKEGCYRDFQNDVIEYE